MTSNEETWQKGDNNHRGKNVRKKETRERGIVDVVLHGNGQDVIKHIGAWNIEPGTEAIRSAKFILLMIGYRGGKSGGHPDRVKGLKKVCFE